MKQLTWKLVLPLAIISFVIFTKWWYVSVEDGPTEILTGFPLPYVCPGWHTSMSLQIFVMELVIDLVAHFAFWFLAIYGLHSYLGKLKLHYVITGTLVALAGLCMAGLVLIGSNPDNIFKFRRDFKTDVMETGYKFIWQHQKHPNYYYYHPRQKPRN